MSISRVRSSRARHFVVWLTVLLVALPILPAAGAGDASIVSVTGAGTRILAANSLQDISDDARFVLFASDSDSVTGAKPGPFESYLYVRDRQAATTTLVAAAALGQGAAVSNNGSVVAFSTEAGLVPADTNGLADVYLVRNGGSPELVSVRGSVVHTTGPAEWVVMSGDGSTVAFQAYASDDQVAGDTPGFLRRNGIVADLTSGDLERIPFPPTAGTVETIQPLALTNDGHRVLVSAFVQTSDAGLPTLHEVLYVWNRPTDQTVIVDDAPYSIATIDRVGRFAPDGEQLHLVTAGPQASLEQTIRVRRIDTDTGLTSTQAEFAAPESLVTDTTTPIPSNWKAAVSADGLRVALHQAPLGDVIWVHDLRSGESISQASGFAATGAGSTFALDGDGSVLAFERIPSDVAGIVDVFASEVGASVFSDTGDSIFRGDILWLFDQTITKGCTPAGTEFCPEDSVTRGQMAAFINRALDIPSSDVDQFTDDDDSIFEADIQALAAAGITMGCNPDGTAFCPDDLVTRGQMAAFLDRALDLPASTVDQFTDDDGSIFEVNIQALSAAGVTRGCNPAGTLYCPDDSVTRGQMAAFLRRALDDSISTP